MDVTASIIAILQLTVKIGEALRDAKDAPADRGQFAADITNISNLLVALLSRLDESSIDPWHANVRDLGGKDGLVYQYRVALEQLKDKISEGDGIKRLTKIVLWKYIKEDAERILLRVERLKSIVQIALEMDHFKLSQVIDSRIENVLSDGRTLKLGVDAIQQDQYRQKHNLIMDWLSSDVLTAQHSDLIARREPDTGLWFIDSPEFTEWVHGTSKTLFCPGIPGAGKTLMAAVAVDHLQNSVQSLDVGVSYLYCNYKTQADQTAPNLFAAVLKQLVQDRPLDAQHLSSLYDRHRVRGTRPSLDEILGALRIVLASYSRVYLIIDALDECTERDGTRSRLLRLCRNLQEKSNLHFMATSRNISVVEEEFKGMPRVEVRASSADVERFVAGKVDGLANCVKRDDDLQRLVQSKIAEAADGMFLLARLHVDSLTDKRTKSKVISALGNLSKGSGALEIAYGEVIGRINGQLQDDRELAKTVLSWISNAQRPLSTGELCHALAVQPGDEELDLDNIPDVEDILSVCAGLVIVDKESQLIRLVHYTTQDYLESIREELDPGAQYQIASTCLTYLCFKQFRSGSCASNADFEARLAKYKFLDYSARYWHRHVATVQEEIAQLAMTLLQNSRLIDCVLQTKSVSRYQHSYIQSFPRQTTGLHLTASLGLPYLSEKLFSQAEKDKVVLADSKDSNGRTPLMWVAQQGQRITADLLLGSDVVNIDARDHDGWTPIMIAADCGHTGIVELLLDTDRVDINLTDNDGWTPLTIAADSGHGEIVKLLLKTGKADADAKAKDGWTPLMLAAGRGHKEIVQLLLDVGNIHVDAKDNIGQTPLMLAATCGHKDIVQLLLDSGRVDVNARDSEWQTPFMLAATCGQKDIAQLLLDTGKVNVNAKDIDGQTALARAAQYRQKDIIEVLVGHNGIELNAKDQYGWTALMIAAQSGNRRIAQLLLGTSTINVDARNNDRHTSLMIAAGRGHKNIVELLLDTRLVEVDAKSFYGWTSLMLAARNGHEDAVALLLDSGKANIDAKNKNGWTAIGVTASIGQARIVKLLLDKGADVSLDTNTRRSPLHLASDNGHLETTELLLQKAPHIIADGSDPVYGTVANMLAFIGCTNGLRILVEHDCAKLHIAEDHQRSPLHLAARAGHVETFQYLTNQGLTFTGVDAKGDNLLCFAAGGGSVDIVSAVSNEIIPSLRQPKNWTPLHWACRAGHAEVLELLLAKGWKGQAVALDGTKRKWTPLAIATFFKNTNMLDDLSAASKTALGVKEHGTYITGELHPGVSCDGCFFPIFGSHFHCRTCVDFDYCFMCKPFLEHLHENHGWDHIGSPTQM